MSRYPHLRATSDGPTSRRRVGPSRASAILLLGVMSSVIAAFGLPMAAASAATAPRAAAPRTSVFCGYANSASKSTSISSAALSPTSLQASYAKLKTEESFIIANSPGQLKPDFVLLFSYLNKFVSILASVKYNYLKLTPTELKSFESADTKQVSAAEKAINSYLTTTYHIKTTTA
jgi:hypothetical protein